MKNYHVLIDADIVDEFAIDMVQLGFTQLGWRAWLKELEDYLVEHGPFNDTCFLKDYGNSRLLGCTYQMWVVTYNVLSPTTIVITSLLIDSSQLPQ